MGGSSSSHGLASARSHHKFMGKGAKNLKREITCPKIVLPFLTEDGPNFPNKSLGQITPNFLPSPKLVYPVGPRPYSYSSTLKSLKKLQNDHNYNLQWFRRFETLHYSDFNAAAKKIKNTWNHTKFVLDIRILKFFLLEANSPVIKHRVRLLWWL